VNDAKTFADRAKLAETCSAKLNLSMPILVDTLDDAVNKAYAAWPDRIYVVGENGKIAYKGAPGPRGFSSDELESFLKNLFSEK
jgi:hypothetical protein